MPFCKFTCNSASNNFSSYSRRTFLFQGGKYTQNTLAIVLKKTGEVLNFYTFLKEWITAAAKPKNAVVYAILTKEVKWNKKSTSCDKSVNTPRRTNTPNKTPTSTQKFSFLFCSFSGERPLLQMGLFCRTTHIAANILFFSHSVRHLPTNRNKFKIFFLNFHPRAGALLTLSSIVPKFHLATSPLSPALLAKGALPLANYCVLSHQCVLLHLTAAKKHAIRRDEILSPCIQNLRHKFLIVNN